MPSPQQSALSRRSLVALATLNFFLADARDGLGPFLDGFLATHGWSPMTLGIVATLGGILGIDLSKFKRRKGDTEWAGPCPVHRPKKNATAPMPG